MENQEIWVKVEQVRKTQVFSGGRDTSSCLGLRQPPSENDTTPAQSLSTSSHCCRGGDRSKVGMDFDMRELSPHPLDARAGNLLAVVQLEALQATAVLQVLQGHVGDEEAVVQFQNPQPLVTAGAVAQVQDPVICDELTVGQTQGLQFRTVDGELDECAVSDQDAFFKIHLLQVMAIPS